MYVMLLFERGKILLQFGTVLLTRNIVWQFFRVHGQQSPNFFFLHENFIKALQLTS